MAPAPQKCTERASPENGVGVGFGLETDSDPDFLHQSGARIWGDNARMASNRIEDIAERLAQALPPGLKGLRTELEDNFRAILRANLERFDLVSRERFEAQAELLARTEAKLAALERRLEELEKKA